MIWRMAVGSGWPADVDKELTGAERLCRLSLEAAELGCLKALPDIYPRIAKCLRGFGSSLSNGYFRELKNVVERCVLGLGQLRHGVPGERVTATAGQLGLICRRFATNTACRESSGMAQERC